MERRSLALLGMYALIAGVVACSSSKPATPVAPSNLSPSSAPDGSTLKVTPATIQSPNFDQKLTTPVVVLTASPATGQFASGLVLQYRFEVRTRPFSERRVNVTIATTARGALILTRRPPSPGGPAASAS